MQNVFLTLAQLGTQSYIMLGVAILLIALLFIMNKNSVLRVLISLVTTYAILVTYMNIAGVTITITAGYFMLLLGGILALAGQITGMVQKKPGLAAKLMGTIGLVLSLVELIFI